MTTQFLILGVVLPAVVAAVSAAVLGFARSLRGGAAAGMACAIGVIAGQIAITGWQGLLPQDVTHRLPHIVLVAGLLALVSTGSPVRGRRWLAPALAAIVLSPVLLGPYADRLSTGMFAALLGGVVAGSAIYAIAWVGALTEHHPVWVAGIMGLSAGMTAVASAVSGSLLLAQLSGVVAASSVAITLAGWPLGLRLEPMIAVAGIALSGCAVLGTAYSSLPPVSLAILAALPLALWAVRAATGRRLRPVATHVVQLATVLVLAGAAVGWAAPPDAPADDSAGEYDYGYGE